MKAKKAAPAASGRSRHRRSVVRSVSPLAAFGVTLALVLGGTGVANASNGGTSYSDMPTAKRKPLSSATPRESRSSWRPPRIPPAESQQLQPGTGSERPVPGGPERVAAGSRRRRLHPGRHRHPISSAERDIANTGALAPAPTT